VGRTPEPCSGAQEIPVIRRRIERLRWEGPRNRRRLDHGIGPASLAGVENHESLSGRPFGQRIVVGRIRRVVETGILHHALQVFSHRLPPSRKSIESVGIQVAGTGRVRARARTYSARGRRSLRANRPGNRAFSSLLASRGTAAPPALPPPATSAHRPATPQPGTPAACWAGSS
jgi:hypothetical protein